MSRLRVGLELTVLELDRGGTARAARTLAEHLNAREDVDLVRFAHGGRARGRVARGLARELAWMPLALPRRARRARLDVLHCPSPLVPLTPLSTPLTVTIHDVLAWTRPEWMSRANVLQHRLVLQHVLPRATLVITSSAHTRDALCARFGLAPDRVVVVPLGVDPAFSPGPGGVAGVDAPYVVAVGTLQPRKDLETALMAFELSADAGAPHDLVVIGARGWRDAATVKRLRTSRHAGRIHIVGHVDDAILVHALRGADALLFPSRYEGFGLPVLEAMACGTPVVAMRTSAVPEVAGDAAVLTEPDEVDAFADAVRALLDDPGRRAALREDGLERAAGYTWARCVELTVAAYRQAMSR